MSKEKTKGIILVAQRDLKYYQMAANLAASLHAPQPQNGKHPTSWEIMLLHDNTDPGFVQRHRNLFSRTKLIEGDPFQVKTQLYDHSPYERTLYLDVDSLCIGDLDAYLQRFEGVPFTSLVHKTTTGHKPEAVSMIWAKVAEIYDYYEIPKDRTFYELNSSAIYWERGEIAKDIFELAQHFYEREWLPGFGPYGPQRLTKSGIGWYPDELAFEVALLFANYDMRTDFRPVAFRYGKDNTYFSWTTENKAHPLFSLPGGTGNSKASIWQVYDSLRMNFSREAAKHLTGSYTGAANSGQGYKISETDKAANKPPSRPYGGHGPRRRTKRIKTIIDRYEKKQSLGEKLKELDTESNPPTD